MRSPTGDDVKGVDRSFLESTQRAQSEAIVSQSSTRS
jgi:hypothetical protein